MYKTEIYNKNRKTIVDFAMAPIGHHTHSSLLDQPTFSGFMSTNANKELKRNTASSVRL